MYSPDLQLPPVLPFLGGYSHDLVVSKDVEDGSCIFQEMDVIPNLLEFPNC